MIPTMLIAGLIVGILPGRWALAGVVVLAMGWSALLLTGGTVSSPSGAIQATIFGLGNAAVGASASHSARLGLSCLAAVWKP